MASTCCSARNRSAAACAEAEPPGGIGVETGGIGGTAITGAGGTTLSVEGTSGASKIGARGAGGWAGFGDVGLTCSRASGVGAAGSWGTGAGGGGGTTAGSSVFGAGVAAGGGGGGGAGAPPGAGARASWRVLGTNTVRPTPSRNTVPHGRPMSPERTWTGSEDDSRPEVTEIVVAPVLKAQKRPELGDAVGRPLASSLGKREPGPLGTTKSPIVGSELVNA